MTTYLDVTLKDGRTISGMADFGKGSPANPMSFDEVATKFHACAEFAGWEKAKAGEVVALVRDLESLPSRDRLLRALSRSPGTRFYTLLTGATDGRRARWQPRAGGRRRVRSVTRRVRTVCWRLVRVGMSPCQ